MAYAIQYLQLWLNAKIHQFHSAYFERLYPDFQERLDGQPS